MHLDTAEGVNVCAGNLVSFSCAFNAVASIINLEFHITPDNFVQIPGTTWVANVFSYCLAHLHIVLISRHFPNYSLLPPTFTPWCLSPPRPLPPPLIFSCLCCYDVVTIFELEWFVKCLLFCYFPLFICFVCCARFAACVFVWLLHNFKQHMANKFLSEFNYFTRPLTICCLKCAAWSAL